MAMEIKLIAEAMNPLLKWVSGDPSKTISGISAPSQARAGTIVFASTDEALLAVKDSPIHAVVVPERLLPQTQGLKMAVLTSPAVTLAMAHVGRRFFPVTVHKQPFDGHRIHPSAVIAASARVSDTAIIGPNVTIGADTEIGPHVVIGPNTVVEAQCRVGEGTHLHGQVSVSHGTWIGKNCEVHPQTSLGTEGFGYAQDREFNHHRITHYGRLIIEDDVQIGAGVTVDKGTFEDSRIGRGCIFDNLIHIGHNFVCGEKNIFVGGVMVAGSVTMGSYCVIGGRVTIAGHLKICDQVQIAGVSAVTKDITKPGQYGGYPLQPLKDSLRSLASLASLPEMRKMLAEISKKVNNAT
jgi:UDP-3-O-[3-hydroxymyristoyl] glucosamine N-acyltransferase